MTHHMVANGEPRKKDIVKISFVFSSFIFPSMVSHELWRQRKISTQIIQMHAIIQVYLPFVIPQSLINYFGCITRSKDIHPCLGQNARRRICTSPDTLSPTLAPDPVRLSQCQSVSIEGPQWLGKARENGQRHEVQLSPDHLEILPMRNLEYLSYIFVKKNRILTHMIHCSLLRNFQHIVLTKNLWNG